MRPCTPVEPFPVPWVRQGWLGFGRELDGESGEGEEVGWGGDGVGQPEACAMVALQMGSLGGGMGEDVRCSDCRGL